ncbi:hypothetical protein L218DRAFT_911412 [Marasmius fiardii PR-910]|nr:hypothetical protein L218DRAFT_911412 [Marasmius fiardii PR-910]
MLPPHHIPLPQQHQSLHLQQQQQQQQQGQQSDPHHLGMPPFEQRGWLQQQQQQLMQMRNQSQNGADMANNSVSHQMVDLMRNPNMNRLPNQQQNFGFMGNQGLNHNQPPFLDQQNQSNLQNRMSPLGFPSNMGSPGGMPPGQNQSNFNINRNMMLQALQRDQNNNRQLELMSLAQNQQNQNGPINFANRLGPTGLPHQAGGFSAGGPPGINQSGGPPQGDLFLGTGGPDAMRRPSPHPHPQNQPSQPPNQPGGPPGAGGFPNPQNPQMAAHMNGKRVISLHDLQERQSAMRNALAQLEIQIRSLTAARPQMADQLFTSKIRAFQADLAQKRDGLTRITQLINQMTSQGTTHMQLPISQAPGGPAVTGGQPWLQQSMQNPLQTPSFGTPAMPGGPNNQPPQSQPNGQPSPSPGHAQAVMNAANPMNAVRPPGQPPHNLNANPFPNLNTASPSNLPFNTTQGAQPGMPNTGVNPNHMGNNMLVGPSAAALGPQQPVPPLAKERFSTSYKNFCNSKQITHNPRLLSIDNLTIDLHTLHTEVMKEGGLGPVQQKDLWAVIAGRLGCVQFPGTATEPPKSGPAAANQLAHVYKEYLADFDRVYMVSLQDNRRKALLFQQISQNPLFAKGMGPNQMEMIVGLADVSATELKAKGMPDDMIRMIESARPALQVLSRDQNLYKYMAQWMANKQQQIGLVQNGGAKQGGGPLMGPDGTLPPQLGVQQPQRPMGGNGVSNHFGGNMMFPIKSEFQSLPAGGGQGTKMQAALLEIQAMKQEYVNKVPNLATVDVSNEQRLEYNNLLEQAHRTALDMERKLPFFHVVFSKQQDTNTRKLLHLIMNIQQQRVMIGFSTPRFIMTLHDLRSAQTILHNASEFVSNTWKSSGGAPGGTASALGGGAGISMPRPPTQPPMTVPQHPSPPQVPPQPQPSPQPNPMGRPPVNLQNPPAGPKKKGNQTTPKLGPASPPNNNATVGAVNTPTPPANPSTPAANAATPTHASSPQTPKSPKSKAPVKPQRTTSKQRRPSTTNNTKPNITPTATPVTEPAQIPTPGVKRPRDEDELVTSNVAAVQSTSTSSASAEPSSQAGVASEPSPPKKLKSDWDGPPSEALIKKEEAVEGIKTTEEASAFLEQMIMQISNADDGGANSLSVDISETIDMILKGCSTVPDGESGNGMSSLLGGDIGASSGVTSPTKDEFVEFFDFSSYAAHEEDDAGSKANTPELISSSSTNPSPESAAGSETDPAHHNTMQSDIKVEEFSDPLRLGTLKEIDGGESAYYQPNEWKWDGAMNTLDQPWAIFNS